MKMSILKNDKSTFWDEVILFLFVAIALAGGICLLVYRPSFWIIASKNIVILGVLLIILSVMFIPSLLYRVMKNDTKHK